MYRCHVLVRNRSAPDKVQSIGPQDCRTIDGVVHWSANQPTEPRCNRLVRVLAIHPKVHSVGPQNRSPAKVLSIGAQYSEFKEGAVHWSAALPSP